LSVTQATVNLNSGAENQVLLPPNPNPRFDGRGIKSPQLTGLVLCSDQLAIQLRDACRQLCDTRPEFRKHLLGFCRDRRIRRNAGEQRFDVARPFGGDHAELVGMPSQRIDRLRLLLHQQFTYRQVRIIALACASADFTGTKVMPGLNAASQIASDRPADTGLSLKSRQGLAGSTALCD
jgi:hypothetical protein